MPIHSSLPHTIPYVSLQRKHTRACVRRSKKAGEPGPIDRRRRGRRCAGGATTGTREPERSSVHPIGIGGMTLEALCAPSDVVIYDTFNAAAAASAPPGSFFFGNAGAAWMTGSAVADAEVPVVTAVPVPAVEGEGEGEAEGEKVQGRRKRRRRARSCNKNREDAESQRMTHIAVERNRRRQMNEYLAVLRSLMPEPYVHRGDQASIVGGAIDFVKELEHTLQSLEVQKRTLLAQQQYKPMGDGMLMPSSGSTITATSSGSGSGAGEEEPEPEPAFVCDAAGSPFARFFAYPQYVWCHPPRDGAGAGADSGAGAADIEVNLVETHASVRVMTPRRPAQLLRMVAGMQELRLTVLHLNVTTLGSVALYSLSVKVEEGCVLTTADDIAAAVHHVLCIIDAEATATAQRMGMLAWEQSESLI